VLAWQSLADEVALTENYDGAEEGKESGGGFVSVQMDN
jgi:hypothetical protein